MDPYSANIGEGMATQENIVNRQHGERICLGYENSLSPNSQSLTGPNLVQTPCTSASYALPGAPGMADPSLNNLLETPIMNRIVSSNSSPMLNDYSNILPGQSASDRTENFSPSNGEIPHEAGHSLLSPFGHFSYTSPEGGINLLSAVGTASQSPKENFKEEKPSGFDLCGSRIRLPYRDQDGNMDYIRGTVSNYSKETGLHKVSFLDGSEAALNLSGGKQDWVIENVSPIQPSFHFHNENESVTKALPTSFEGTSIMPSPGSPSSKNHDLEYINTGKFNDRHSIVAERETGDKKSISTLTNIAAEKAKPKQFKRGDIIERSGYKFAALNLYGTKKSIVLCEHPDCYLQADLNIRGRDADMNKRCMKHAEKGGLYCSVENCQQVSVLRDRCFEHSSKKRSLLQACSVSLAAKVLGFSQNTNPLNDSLPSSELFFSKPLKPKSISMESVKMPTVDFIRAIQSGTKVESILGFPPSVEKVQNGSKPGELIISTEEENVLRRSYGEIEGRRLLMQMIRRHSNIEPLEESAMDPGSDEILCLPTGWKRTCNGQESSLVYEGQEFSNLAEVFLKWKPKTKALTIGICDIDFFHWFKNLMSADERSSWESQLQNGKNVEMSVRLTSFKQLQTFFFKGACVTKLQGSNCSATKSSYCIHCLPIVVDFSEGKASVFAESKVTTKEFLPKELLCNFPGLV